jgi:hypothetical protein
LTIVVSATGFVSLFHALMLKVVTHVLIFPLFSLITEMPCEEVYQEVFGWSVTRSAREDRKSRELHFLSISSNRVCYNLDGIN